MMLLLTIVANALDCSHSLLRFAIIVQPNSGSLARDVDGSTRTGCRQTILLTVSWTYNDADRPLTETIGGGTLGGWSVVHVYNKLQRTHQRLRQSSTTRQEARFGYDMAGRMSAVTNGLSTGLRAAYGYLPNSSLIGTLTLTNHNTGRGMATTRDYDRLNRLRTISSRAFGGAAPVLPVAFEYQYNAANQRTRVNREDGAYWIYTYDELGQVVSGRKYWADGTEVAGQQFDYTFDTIGNRKNTGGRVSAVSTYSVNRLNQYAQRSVPNQVDVLGIANPTADVTVRVLGGTTFTAGRKGEYYHHALAVGNNVYPTIEAKSLYGATEIKTNRVFNPPSTETFVHDADGNLTSDGRWTYTWDAENRLIAMIRDTDSPAGARQWLRFEYDHQGRRIRKWFGTNSGSGWVLSSDTAFAYDGWNLVAELNAASSNTRLRTYLWGLDLSTSEQGAGGVGGLLLVTDYEGTTTYHWPAYDGNGNVAALVAQTDGSLSARYEYGPFGEAIRATGAMGKKNPIRFSTKYTDDQTGLLYYGYRYYNPTTGRWINRDPLGESGFEALRLRIADLFGDGPNLYAFVGNNPVNTIDLFGLVKGSGVNICREPGLGGHQWIEYEGGSVGFYPGPGGIWPGGTGTILSPDPHASDNNKRCKEVYIPDCADKDCFQHCIGNLKNSAPGFYCVIGDNCRAWTYEKVRECTKKCNNDKFR
jgi:RHS repeat-associated protein